MKLVKKINAIFSRKTKIKLLILLIAIVIGAMIETLAISIISPFISILLTPETVETNAVIKSIFVLLHLESITQFLMLMSFMLAFIYIFRGVYLYSLAKIQHRFLLNRRVDVSNKLLSKILGYSYLFHSSHNISELQRIILRDVECLFIMLDATIMLVTDIVASLFIISFLLFLSPGITMCLIGLALLCVLIYFKLFRKTVKQAGENARAKYIDVTKSVNQALGGIKEVKILQKEQYFQNVFKQNSDGYSIANQKYLVLNSLPKLIIEAICFGGAFILLGTFMLMGNTITGLIPQLSVFVLAAFRILPATSRMVNYTNTIIYHKSSIDGVYDSLYGIKDEAPQFELKTTQAPENNSDIIIQNISFKYPQTEELVLENASFVIPEKKSVAFVGPSGAGKTTLADIILGILTPQSGTVFYKGTSIHQSFDGWSHEVGYIPQQIYLLDETILENVAFGIALKDIDHTKVWIALEQAQLIDFVKSLPDKEYTLVGDRGIRLSGGQRQRIGIARALYNDPPILVLDEATSSLDNETEKAVMDAIMKLQGNKTMIIVAHRLSTIEHCNLVYRVEKKKIIREK